MRTGISGCRWLAAALLCWSLAAALSWNCGLALSRPPAGLYAQSAGKAEAAQACATQKLSQAGGFDIAEYGFANFNGDRLQVRYQAPQAAYRDYKDGFGYKRDELDAADRAHKAREYLAARGFKLRAGNVIEADVPQLVRRSAGPLRSVALAFEDIAQDKHYDSESLIGSVTALVQTALHYKLPPVLAEGRHTGGILPPVEALVRGWGDCDTKTGLLASILANWPHMRMVGLAVPGHYLMGVLRIPTKGDAFVDYQGLHYVLIEPAGPAWLAPGSVSADTMPKLESEEGFRIEPFFE